jgi:acyl transferase domain-containing protein/acyl carrier protein
VAIVGAQCRFPGAACLDEFWANLRAGVDSVREIPAERFDLSLYYSPEAAPGKTSCRTGGFLDGVDRFDREFFEIPADEAARLDPQQRLLLEVAWETLEGAGAIEPRFAASDTGVFVGACNRDYEALTGALADPSRIGPYYGTGTAASLCAGRLSHVLGLRGPSLTVDTACSSSLVAVHLACQSLRAGECRAALAGGVNLALTPTGFIYGSQLGAVSPTGRCRSFGAEADGYVRGEGCALVLLKRLEDALADADAILAVIRSSLVNHDGRASSLTAPNLREQVRLLRRAWRLGGVRAGEIGYIEAHGSGTPLGDPIEARAIALAAEGRTAPMPLGSVKSNVGHLEAAAGVAGLLKAALCVRHAELVPSLHAERLNPHLDGLAVRVTGAEAWPEGRRIAGVSSFGVSGTNAHVVVEAAPPRPQAAERTTAPGLLLLSARDAAARAELARAWESRLQRCGAAEWPALLYTAAARRRGHEWRLAIPACGPDEARERLAAWRRGESGSVADGRAGEGGPLVFVYGGHGGHWDAMGAALMREAPAFRRRVEQVDGVAEPLLGWSVREALQSGATPPAGPVEAAQVLIFAVQSGLTALWEEWGVRPDAVIGHSMGEVAAAQAAGALSLEDASTVLCLRARLLQQAARGGGMMAVELAAEECDALPGLEVAARNAPRWTVLSGSAAAIAASADRLAARGVHVRVLEMAGLAAHSSAVEEAAGALRRALADRAGKAPDIPMMSSVTASWVEAGLDAAYWGANLRRPVLFLQSVRRLLAEGYVRFLEVHPHPALGSSIAQTALREVAEAAVWSSMRRSEGGRLDVLACAGKLWCAGRPLAWEAVSAPRCTPADLPRYPWRRERCWLEPATPRSAGSDADAVARVVEAWPVEGAHAVNRERMAPHAFLSPARDGVLFYARGGGSLTALLYAGPPSSFVSTAQAAAEFARAEGLHLNLLAREAEAEGLAALGWSATPAGLLHRLDDLASFHLQGGAMRRLRYLHDRYQREAGAAVVEYPEGVGRDDVLALAEAWGRRKSGRAGAVEAVGRLLHGPRIDRGRRIFAATRNGRADCAVLLSPAPLQRGYLLDLEFYGPETPAGALEFAIVGVVEKLRAEGARSLGLGGSYGTALDPHPAADAEAARLLRSFHDSGLLNGDGNAQFKEKFRPTRERLFLCRPAGTQPSSVEDLLLALRGDAGEPAAPLQMERIPLGGEMTVRQGRLGAAESAYFAGHSVEGLALLPASAMIDCLLQAAAGLDAVELADFAIEAPLPVAEGRLVQASIAGGHASLYSSDSPQRGAWTRHATAAVRERRPANRGAAFDASSATARLAARDPVAFYALAERAGVRYSGEFRGLRKLWTGAGEAVGWIGGAMAARTPATVCPPALLDAALQVLAAAAGAFDSGDLTVMRSATSIRVYRPLPAAMWCHARVEPGGALRGSVRLYDISMAPVAEIAGVAAETIGSAAPAAPTYAPRWEPAAPRSARDAAEVCLLPSHPDPVESSRLACRAALAAAQSVIERGRPATLWLAARRGDIGHTAVRGFARSFAAEHPDLFGGWVEADGDAVDLARDCRAPRLRRVRLPGARLKVRPDAAYLVTGGFRGLGLAAAVRLAERGARHIVLTGRSDPPPQLRLAFRHTGVEPALEVADAADPAVMAALVDRIDSTVAPLRGVIHAAAVVEDAAVATLDAGRLERVLRPKVAGAWSLHLATRDRALDWFVLFSSAADLLGPPGQSAYAAANAFLAGLAEHRRGAGLPATAIGWGPLAETGQARARNHLDRLRREGVAALSTRAALDLMERAAASKEPHLLALDVDWRRFLATRPWLAGLVEGEADGAAPAARPGPRLAPVEPALDYLTRVVAAQLGAQPGAVHAEASLRALGLDSLGAVALRNRVEADRGVRLPVVAILAAERLSHLAEALRQTGATR